MYLDLIGCSPGLGKPYSMLQGRTFGGHETIANEPENGVNDVQVRIFHRTFKIDPRRDSVLRFILAQLRDSFSSPRLHFARKAAVFERRQFQVIENHLCISLDLPFGGCRLYIKIDESSPHIYFDVLFDDRAYFRKIDIADLEIEVEGRHPSQRVGLGSQLEVCVRHHSRLAIGLRHHTWCELGAVGDVGQIQIQSVDSYVGAVLARDSPQADFAVVQDG